MKSYISEDIEGMKRYLDEEILADLETAIQKKAGLTASLSVQSMIEAVNSLYTPTDILTKKNLNQWTKNIEFGGTLTYTDDGIHKINYLKDYYGVSGYERYYLPVSVSKNTTYAFVCNFCSPTGFLFKDFDNYGDTGERTYVFGVEPTGTWSPNSTTNGESRLSLIARSSTTYNTSATEDYNRLVCVFNSGSYTTVYLTISMGYIEDGKAVDLCWQDISLYQLK